METKKMVNILDEGRDNKVLVQWIKATAWTNGELEIEVEYSIHTKGINHTDEDYDLVWGMYFDDLKRAKGTFQYYKSEGENFRNIVKDIKDFSDKWYEEQDPYAIDHNSSLEFLAISPNGNIDETYVFQGDRYRELEKEYRDSCLDSFVSFEDYVIYSSQEW